MAGSWSELVRLDESARRTLGGAQVILPSSLNAQGALKAVVRQEEILFDDASLEKSAAHVVAVEIGAPALVEALIGPGSPAPDDSTRAIQAVDAALECASVVCRATAWTERNGGLTLAMTFDSRHVNGDPQRSIQLGVRCGAACAETCCAEGGVAVELSTPGQVVNDVAASKARMPAASPAAERMQSWMVQVAFPG